jgi:hypothetical protein
MEKGNKAIRRVRGIPTLSQLVRSTIWLLEMTKLFMKYLLIMTVKMKTNLKVRKGTKQTTLKHLCFTSAKIWKVLVDFFKQKET